MISHRKPNKNRSFIDVVKIGVNAMLFYLFFRSKNVNRRFIPQTIKFRLRYYSREHICRSVSIIVYFRSLCNESEMRQIGSGKYLKAL